MTANEFVKKFGWNAARTCILNCACPDDRWLMRHGDLISDQDFDDLKRLVESYELVDEFGDDVSYLKSYLSECNEVVTHFHLDNWNQTFTRDRLKQAIADVESCQ